MYKYCIEYHNKCVNCEFDHEFIIMHSYDNDILQIYLIWN